MEQPKKKQTRSTFSALLIFLTSSDLLSIGLTVEKVEHPGVR